MSSMNRSLYEVRDFGDRVLVRGRLRGHGASFERSLWQVVEVRDQKGVWWRAFGTEAEALEAAGLSE
jgi:hypothetical protein